MNKFNPNIFLLLLLISFGFSCSSPEGKKKSPSIKTRKYSAKEIYQQTVNNTVTIITDRGLGSGFFIDSNIIVTNYHVIEGVNAASIALNNTNKKYVVAGYLSVDKINDLVLLQVNYKNNSYILIENQIPSPGEKIFAIGSPIGLAKTISEGIVSGIRDFQSRKLLQISAPISHGSSGCPILNENAKLVGVAVGAFSEGNNINFCIPVNFLKTLLDFKTNYPIELASLLTISPQPEDKKKETKSNNESSDSKRVTVIEIPKDRKKETKKNTQSTDSKRVTVRKIPKDMSHLIGEHFVSFQLHDQLHDEKLMCNIKASIYLFKGKYYIKKLYTIDKYNSDYDLDIKGEITLYDNLYSSGYTEKDRLDFDGNILMTLPNCKGKNPYTFETSVFWPGTENYYPGAEFTTWGNVKECASTNQSFQPRVFISKSKGLLNEKSFQRRR